MLQIEIFLQGLLFAAKMYAKYRDIGFMRHIAELNNVPQKKLSAREHLLFIYGQW